MRIALVSGGAAGMYCGSCLHDNALAGELQRMGHDTTLIPLYTPLRTDEESVSQKRVFYGAVNTYLQVKSPRLARLPGFLRRWLDRPRLLEWVGKLGSAADARDLGELALAVLQGEEGASRSQLEQLVTWMAADLRPQVVHLQNSMFLGLAHRLREALGCKVVCSLQGEDLFLETLIEPYKSRALEVLKKRQGDVDAFLSHSGYYADFMAGYLGIRRRAIHIAPLGLTMATEVSPGGRGAAAGEAPFVVGYLARICPEKGFGVAAEAFQELAARLGPERVRFKVAGYLSPPDEPFVERTVAGLKAAGLGDSLEMVGEVDREGKVAFLRSLDVLAVPTLYREPKGLFALEAMACGVPVVLPRHGAFPELLADGGGLLVEPESATAVADALEALLADPDRRAAEGAAGRASVEARHTMEAAATGVLGLYSSLVEDEAGDSRARQAAPLPKTLA